MREGHIHQATSMQATKQETIERVKEAHENAMSMMRKAGYEIGDVVQVAIDPQLPFMGYTTPQRGGFRIVVSGMAVESGMLEALLVHEMSHVYRMQTKHPSHNGRIIDEVVNNLGRRALSNDYQQKTIRELVNHLEDLYADDIAMKVIRESGFLSEDKLSDFLEDWVKDELVRSDNATRDRWVNSAIMVNNARAIGQMRRHGISDAGGKADATNQRLLHAISPAAAKQFEYFMNLMMTLKEDITEEDYRRLLTDYLNKFLKIAEN